MSFVGFREPSTSHTLKQWGGGRPCASDNYSEPERQEFDLMAIGRILVLVPPTLHFCWRPLKIELWLCTPDPKHFGFCFLHLPTCHGVCRRWGIGEDYAHVARSACLGSRLPQTVPSDNSWCKIVWGGGYHSEVVLFSGTFSNRRVSCVGAHNPQSNFLLTLSRQCVVHFCL